VEGQRRLETGEQAGSDTISVHECANVEEEFREQCR